MKCRHCGESVDLNFCDLGAAPPSNAYLSATELDAPERYFPLRVLVCTHCWLVQTQDFAQREELFSAEYGYFSSMSASWVEHARRYAFRSIERFSLGAHSKVVEVASNDGYLLRHFQEQGIPCLGIEPTASTAAASRALGIDTREVFFGEQTACDLVAQGIRADLMAANNVLAHVPDINDFVAGFRVLLAPTGVVTFEFPHLLKLIQQTQFDTLYHEHYSYLSLSVVSRVLASQSLIVFDVEELPTHGGSLRVYAQHQNGGPHAKTDAVTRIMQAEALGGLLSEAPYRAFQSEAERVKDGLLEFLLRCRREGRKVGAYGAAAKGNTMLNFAGVKPDLLPYVVDKSPGKQGRFMPGSRIPIVDETHLFNDKPDLVLILPWNIKEEVAAQLQSAKSWGARFVTAVPRILEF